MPTPCIAVFNSLYQYKKARPLHQVPARMIISWWSWPTFLLVLSAWWFFNYLLDNFYYLLDDFFFKITKGPLGPVFRGLHILFVEFKTCMLSIRRSYFFVRILLCNLSSNFAADRCMTTRHLPGRAPPWNETSPPGNLSGYLHTTLATI